MENVDIKATMALKGIEENLEKMDVPVKEGAADVQGLKESRVLQEYPNLDHREYKGQSAICQDHKALVEWKDPKVKAWRDHKVNRDDAEIVDAQVPVESADHQDLQHLDRKGNLDQWAKSDTKVLTARSARKGIREISGIRECKAKASLEFRDLPGKSDPRVHKGLVQEDSKERKAAPGAPVAAEQSVHRAAMGWGRKACPEKLECKGGRVISVHREAKELVHKVSPETLGCKGHRVILARKEAKGLVCKGIPERKGAKGILDPKDCLGQKFVGVLPMS